MRAESQLRRCLPPIRAISAPVCRCAKTKKTPQCTALKVSMTTHITPKTANHLSLELRSKVIQGIYSQTLIFSRGKSLAENPTLSFFSFSYNLHVLSSAVSSSWKYHLIAPLKAHEEPARLQIRIQCQHAMFYRGYCTNASTYALARGSRFLDVIGHALAEIHQDF